MAVTDPDPLSGSELATFVAAMDAASVHGAADALNLTASAVTKRLQSLERRLCVALFERGRFGLRSTQAGRSLYPEARQALIALANARESVAASRDAHALVLSLSASHTVGEFLLPAWLAAFRRHEPRARAQVDIVNSPGVIAAIRDRQADIGFVEGTDDLADLEAMTAYEDELVAVVAADHRWARRRSIRAGELSSDTFFSRESRSGTRAVAVVALQDAGVQLVPALEVASIQGLKRAVASGGFAIMSRLAVEAEVRADTLHTLAVRDVALTRRLRAIRDARNRPGPTATAFWNWLAQETAALGK